LTDGNNVCLNGFSDLEVLSSTFYQIVKLSRCLAVCVWEFLLIQKSDITFFD